MPASQPPGRRRYPKRDRGHIRGSVEVRLLEALVTVVLNHANARHRPAPDANGEVAWLDAERADFLSAIAREEARLEAERAWLEELYDRAGLTPQERRAVSLAAEGWESEEIAREMTQIRLRGDRSAWISQKTVSNQLSEARRKLRPFVGVVR